MKEFLYFPYDYFKNKIRGKNTIRQTLKPLFEILPSSPVLLEAGAFNGADTLSMHYAWPNATIYAFEPVTESFALLKKRTRFIKNVNIYNMALGDRTGTSTINVSQGKSAASSSLLEPKDHITSYPDVEFESSLEIKTITLNDWAKQYAVSKVDFMWLDMQGFELFALKAGNEVLQNVKAIYMEVSIIELYKGSPLYDEVREWMASKGFKVLLEELNETDGNVLFVRA